MATDNLKSILKKSVHSAPKQTKDERDRETALYHANLIQERKDIELEIVLNTEQLIDLPTSPLSTSEDPSAEDIKTFKVLLRPFQPSDYDSLIQERNINDHCGYALCPNPRVKDGRKGDYRIISKSGKARDMKIVPRAETERWCSEICARRALYVRVQLSETPAWERIAVTEDIELMGEVKTEAEKNEEQLAEDLRKLDLRAGPRAVEGRTKEKRINSTNGTTGISIKEKVITTPANAPSLTLDDMEGKFDSTHLSLEGYHPTFENHRQRLRDMDARNREDDAADDDRDDLEDWL